MSTHRPFRIIALLATLAALLPPMSVVFAQSGGPDIPAPAPVVYRINSDGSVTQETAPSRAIYVPAPPPPADLARIAQLRPQTSLSNGTITPLTLSSGYYYYYAWYYVGNAYTKQTVYFYQDIYGGQTVYWTQWDRSNGSAYSVTWMYLYNVQSGDLVYSWDINRSVNPTLYWEINQYVASNGFGSRLRPYFNQGGSTYYVDVYFGN